MEASKKAVQQTTYPHIVKIDGVVGGQAVIEGTRIAVWHLVGYYYKVGMSVEDICGGMVLPDSSPSFQRARLLS